MPKVSSTQPPNFYSRASCEARQSPTLPENLTDDFYSRASCEARQSATGRDSVAIEFLLTRLMRGATMYQIDVLSNLSISTHAPHARRDPLPKVSSTQPPNFYSRASCEARQSPTLPENLTDDFYSRASCEARLQEAKARQDLFISTHAPHARRDTFSF